METEKKRDGGATAPSLTQTHMHDGLAAPLEYSIDSSATQHCTRKPCRTNDGGRS
jgi:hypothetical protein